VTTPSPAAQDAMKRAAARRAVEEIADGMVVGLGSGSTAELALEALAARMAQGLRVAGIPTSERTASLARRLGIALVDFSAHRRLDLAIDGADQVERSTLNLMKGRGGALLREKIVASAADRMIVVVDETKIVERLGGAMPLPVEIVAFGWQTVLERFAAIGAAPQLRHAAGQPYVTDGGNYIADCVFAQAFDAPAVEERLSAITGVVETGLFIGLASEVVIGRASGIEVIERKTVMGSG
jgi:ribose 5-phosphate isomerase A